MFERFTESARRSLFFARAETSQRRGDSIMPEDLLAGIMRVVPDAIGRLSLDPAATIPSAETADDFMTRLRQDAAWVGHSAKEIVFSDTTKRALQRAAEEADALGHTPIRPEHLILGLLRDDGSDAWRILYRAGVTLQEARRKLAAE